MSMNRRFPRKFPVSSNFRFIGVITGISPRRQSSCYSIFIQKRHDSRSSLLRSKKTAYFEKLLFSSCLPALPQDFHIPARRFRPVNILSIFATRRYFQPVASRQFRCCCDGTVGTQLPARPNIFLEVGRVGGRTIHVWNHICG